MDLHHNLFYNYRGPNAEIVDHDRQLENNVTKALINTLELGGIEMCGPFLDWLGIKIKNATTAKYLLQRQDLPSGTAAEKPTRVLLFISKRRINLADAGTSEMYESVPDAWIYGDGFAVLIESKVNNAAFSQRQIQAHLERLRSRQRDIVQKTWGDIHGFFVHLLPHLTGAPSARFLAEQLIQFLEYSGMSEFTGFRAEHFHYFLMHDDDDARRWIRDQVKYFAMQIQAGLQQIDAFYKAYDVGSLKIADSHCWVAFGPSGDKYRRVTHQTISLNSDGLRVFVNTELKAATDRLKCVLEQSDAEFRAALKDSHIFAPFELILEERAQRQASLYDYTPKMRLHSSILNETAGDVAWNAFAQTVGCLPLPYLRIERHVPAQTLVERSKGDPAPVVQYLLEILQNNHAIVRLLNTKLSHQLVSQ